MKTEPEFRADLLAFLRSPSVLAAAYMRRGKSRWIDLSLDEGWGKSLQEFIASSARNRMRATGALPSFGELDGFALKDDDLKWFRAHGAQFLKGELEDIMHDRHGVIPEPKRLTGESAA